MPQQKAIYRTVIKNAQRQVERRIQVAADSPRDAERIALTWLAEVARPGRYEGYTAQATRAQAQGHARSVIV